MNEINIRISANHYSISISNTKYLLGNDYNLKYEIMAMIQKCCLSAKDSEYAIEENTTCIAEFNEATINSKNSKYFYIGHQYNVDEDIKMTSRSITKEYIECVVSEVEYDDTLNTINSLIVDFNNSYFSDILDIDPYELMIEFPKINPKTIMKPLVASLIRDGLEANNFDLSFDEKLLIQSKMIKIIAQHNKGTNYYLHLDLPITNTNFQRIIEIINEDNVFTFVNTTLLAIDVPYKDIIIFNNNYIYDLADEEILYDHLILKKGLGNNLYEINKALNALNKKDEIVKYQFYNTL